MAEFLAVLGGAAAMLEVAGSCVKTARVLNRFLKNNNIALDEIHRFCFNLSSFSISVELAHQELERRCKACPNSPSIHFIQTSGPLAILCGWSRLMEYDLRDIRRWVGSLKGDHKLLVALKWWLKKAEVLALQPQMDSIIGRLHLMLEIVKLEAAYTSDSADDKKEM